MALNTRALERPLIFCTLGVSAAALALSVYLVQSLLPFEDTAVLSLRDVYDHYMIPTRMVTGALLVLAWPAILHLSARMLRLQFPRPSYFLTLLGILLGASTYCLTFLPWPHIAAALVLPPLCALACFILVLQLRPRAAVSLWLFQGTLALCVGAGSVWGIESAAAGVLLSPMREVTAIYERAQQSPRVVQTVHINAQRSDQYLVIWPPSGSEWLDRRANWVQADITLTPGALGWRTTLYESQNPIGMTESTLGNAYSPVFNPKPDVGYWIKLSPPPQKGTVARITSLLPLKGEHYAETP